MRTNPLRVAVVGAGAGGLFAAAFLARAGVRVEVFEAQAHVGGCASCFSIGPRRFHAGATTLVGLEPDMPLARMLAALELDLPHHVLENTLAIVHGGERRVMSHDTEVNAEAFTARYGAGLGAFWRHAARVAPLAWSFIGDAALPPGGVEDLAALAADPRAWALLPDVVSTTSAKVRRLGPVNAEGLTLLDELLLVSTQSTAAQTPALFGAVGCEYLQRRLYMPHGGLGSLFERLSAQVVATCGAVHLRSPVEGVRADAERPTVRVGGLEVAYDAVVLGVTCWDAAKLVTGDVRPFFARQAARHDRAWSAAGGYFAFDDVFAEGQAVYTQVVLDAPMQSTGARGVFVTIPPRGDTALAGLPGERCLTVSCHTAPESWFDASPEAFAERRALLLEELHKALRIAVPALAGAKCHAAHPATPRTWAGFTGRHLGRVGGLPFGRDLRTLAYPTGRTPHERLLAVGDTVFPGQSVTATALGARRAAERLLATLRA
jgi:phytoene dehydrogenase-like protein